MRIQQTYVIKWCQRMSIKRVVVVYTLNFVRFLCGLFLHHPSPKHCNKIAASKWWLGLMRRVLGFLEWNNCAALRCASSCCATHRNATQHEGWCSSAMVFAREEVHLLFRNNTWHEDNWDCVAGSGMWRFIFNVIRSQECEQVVRTEWCTLLWLIIVR